MADFGAPLGMGFLEPVVSKAQVLLLARRAAHPRAAALFIDWALSKQGLTYAHEELLGSSQ
jgi:ABC-type Fe3+ transport system substrate-binding protein